LSLSAAQKAIDKHLGEKAQDVVLNLPVVMLLGNSRVDETAWSIKQAVISGVDREDLSVQGARGTRAGAAFSERNRGVCPPRLQGECGIVGDVCHDAEGGWRR